MSNSDHWWGFFLGVEPHATKQAIDEVSEDSPSGCIQTQRLR
jgi:hypothetical protein